MTRPPPGGVDLRNREFSRVLLIKPSSLGDIVHALPVLHGLRTRYPTARIDWLINKGFAPLLENHPDVNELIVFDRRRFGQMARNPRAAAAFCRFVGDLRSRDYDLVVDLQGLFRTGFLARASGSSVRIGPQTAREGAGWFYSHRIPSIEDDAHAVDRSYRVAGMLGFEDVPITFSLPIAEADVDTIGQLLDQAEIAGRALVVVAPGARWETKMWPPERFAELIDAVHQNCEAACVLIGAQSEVQWCKAIERCCRRSPVNLAGETTLAQFAAIIRSADAVVCHDSAAVHLAAVYGRPLVCLTGPTNPLRTGPYGRIEDVVRLDLECSPCYLRRLSQCRHDHRCMRDLESQNVFEAVRDRLSRTSVTTP